MADMWEAEFGHLDKKKVGGGERWESHVSRHHLGLRGCCENRGFVPALPAPLSQSTQHRIFRTRHQPSTLPPHHPPLPPQHMMDMLTLTTRMNALARITLGNVNIAATTALQVHKQCRGQACRCRAGSGDRDGEGFAAR